MDGDDYGDDFEDYEDVEEDSQTVELPLRPQLAEWLLKTMPQEGCVGSVGSVCSLLKREEPDAQDTVGISHFAL